MSLILTSVSFGTAQETEGFTHGFLDLREQCGNQQHNITVSKDLKTFSLLLPSPMIDCFQTQRKHLWLLGLVNFWWFVGLFFGLGFFYLFGVLFLVFSSSTETFRIQFMFLCNKDFSPHRKQIAAIHRQQR